VKAFECNVCGKRFSREGNLLQHKLIHSSEKPYKCNLCDKQFTRSGNLKQHERRHKTLEKRFRCNKCDKFFSSAGNLKQHEILHTRKTPLRCNYCGKCFTWKANLRQHNRMHTGEKPFESNGYFKIHQRSHSFEMKPVKIEQHESCFRICDFLSDIKQEVQDWSLTNLWLPVLCYKRQLQYLWVKIGIFDL